MRVPSSSPSRRAAGVAAVVAIVACARSLATKPTATSFPDVSPSAFSHFVDQYFDSVFAFRPSEGTADGFHQYDTKIEDLSAASFTHRIATLKHQLVQLDALRAGTLPVDDSVDAAILDGAIRSELQDEDVLQNWRKNPMGYVSLPGYAVDPLMKRSFAAPVERLKSVIARLHGVPAILTAMRTNIQTPPEEFTDLAIRLAEGSVGFFKTDVRQWANGAAGSDTATLHAFVTVNDSVVAAMQAAADWLKHDLLPRSTGTFAIGAENFANKLRYDEMVDIPLDRLLAIGEANLNKDYDAFVTTAQAVAPGKTPAEAMASIEADHPTPATLISSAAATVAGARQFLIDHRIVDIPSDVMPKVTETPPYARAGTFAALDPPGAYETKATEAFYYVTPPEKDWDAKHVEEHLRTYNKPVMSIITAHEVFPGHYVQFLYAKQFPTKTRKLLYTPSNIEGWAHYGEQMVVEQGFGNGDPKVRLAQLSEALLRDCRYVAGIKEHTQNLSVRQAADDYFVKKCFQEPANAYAEALRGTYNPTYLYYTLGKLEIYKLRSDYQRATGKDFSLRKFHDQFLKQGFVPIKLIRRMMLPNDTSAVL